jgi:zinc/manganese transport system substrate-binding protein
MRTILKAIVGLTAALGLVLGATGCSTSEPTGHAGGVLYVAVAENFWGSIVSQLAGPDALVTSLISNPHADPHDYEPTVADAQTIASAQYVIENGIGYDAWVDKLVHVDRNGRTVLNVGDLLGLDDGANPHQWYSPAAVHRFVTRVSADLARLDPQREHRAAYAQRRNAFETKGLHDYNRLLAEIKHRFAGTPIGASESVVAPWATGAGLDLVTPEKFLEAIAEGNEPTRSDKETVDGQIADRKIKAFVYNRQNATPDVQRLVDAARGAHIPVVTITETMPSEYPTFQDWQVAELRALLAALDRSAGTP